MKKFSKLSFLALSFLVSNIVSADNPVDYTPTGRIPVSIRKTKPSETGRPRTPDFQEVDCEYEDGVLYIEFMIPEGDAAITVTGTSGFPVVSDNFDTSSLYSVSVGEAEYLYSVEITTSEGNEYVGLF